MLRAFTFPSPPRKQGSSPRAAAEQRTPQAPVRLGRFGPTNEERSLPHFLPALWIPAFAGMTIGLGSAVIAYYGPSAQAGMLPRHWRFRNGCNHGLPCCTVPSGADIVDVPSMYPAITGIDGSARGRYSTRASSRRVKGDFPERTTQWGDLSNERSDE